MARSLRYRSGLAWALGIGVVTALLSARGALGGLEWRAYDLQLGARARSERASDVIIVIIGDRCLEPQRLGPWPWPMARHAQLVRRIAAAQPRAIIFDLLFFGEPDPDSARFAHALREAGNVYLAAAFLEGERPLRVGRHGVRMSELRAPPEPVRSAAAGIGAVNVFPEPDGVVRAAPLVFDYQGRPFPSLALRVADDLAGGEERGAGDRVPSPQALGAPVNWAGEMLISYTGGYRHFPTVAYADVLEGKVADEHFRGRTVVVGFSATGLSDARPTPLSPACPGVEVNAHTLETLMRGDFIRPLGGPGNALVALGLAVVLGAALPRWRPMGALGAAAGAAVALAAVAVYLFQAAGIWMNLVTPALGVVMVGLAIAADGYRAGEREKISLQSSLDALGLATRMIAASTSRQPLLEAMREEAALLTAAREAHIWLVDDQQQALRLAGEAVEASAPLEQGALGRVAREGAPVLGSAADDPGLATEVMRAAALPAGPVALMPLKRQNAVIGVVQVNRAPGQPPFGEREVELLSALCNEAAVALENVELYEKLEGKVELANRELVRAYSQLAFEKDRIEALLENMADGVIMTDAADHVLYVNPAAEQMFQVRGREIENEPLGRHLPIAGLASVIATARSQPGRLTTEKLVVEEPQRMVLSAASALIADEQGQEVGVVTVISDVTLMQELSDMKTEFVSLVSHELRTPLTSIQGFAQTLRADVEGTFAPAERQEFLEIIEGECMRLLSMINELLDASRIEAGRPLPMNWAQVSLPEMVERAVKLQATGAAQHRFEVEFAPDFPRIDADADRVAQVLTNIISNAVKYSPDGGRIRISGAVQGAQVVVAVADQGLGMTQAQMEQLFQRYHRVESDASRRIRGTGLGLYLTRGLVEAHGGRTWAHSDGPGKGSTFSFSLPVKRVEERPEEPAASPAAGPE